MHKKLITVLMALCCCLCIVFAGCFGSPNNNSNSDNKDVDENSTNIIDVSIYTEPNKTFYKIGESLLSDGGKLKITRANGTTEIIPFNDSNVSLSYPSVFSYWTDNQRVGVKYNDPLNNNAQSETAYLGVKVGLDIDYKLSGYSNWNNNSISIYYPSSYTVEPNEGEPGIGGVTVIDYTKKIVSFSETGFSTISGKSKSIFIKSTTGLNSMLKQSISYLDSYYTQQYQEEYRKSYNDNSLIVTVNHQGLTNAEYNSLVHFQWKEAIHQVIQIKKTGTFLGLGDWSKRVDRYIIEADNNDIDISFWANNSIYDNNEIQKVLSTLTVKYNAVYTDAI